MNVVTLSYTTGSTYFIIFHIFEPVWTRTLEWQKIWRGAVINKNVECSPDCKKNLRGES